MTKPEQASHIANSKSVEAALSEYHRECDRAEGFYARARKGNADEIVSAISVRAESIMTARKAMIMVILEAAE